VSDTEIQQLVEQIRQHRNSKPGRDAVKALCDMGPPAVPYLVEVLDYDHVPGSWSEDVSVIRALGYLGDERAVPPLHRLLKDIGPDNDWFRYMVVTAAIGLCGDKSVFPALIEGLASASVEGTLGSYHALLRLGGEVVPDLLGVLADPAKWLRGHADYPEDLPDDSQFLKISSFESWIIDVLGEVGDQRAVPKLLEFLSVPIGETYLPLVRHPRRSAIVALGRIGDTSALPALRKELAADDVDLRLHAAGAILQILAGKRPAELLNEVTQTLIDGTNAGDVGHRILAIRTLTELEHPDVVPALIAKLADNDLVWSREAHAKVPVARYAAEALEHIGTSEALEVVEAWRWGRGKN
jgi:HEAT repeat protein